MRVFEVMSEGVETVKPNLLASQARELMRQKQIHHMVVMSGAQVLGVLSDRDLGGPRLTQAAAGRAVSELMSSPAVTVDDKALVKKAANVMRGRSIGSLVVTSAKGRVVGIVTVSDLLDLVGRGAGRQPSREARPARRRRVG